MDYTVDRTQLRGSRSASHKCSSSIIDPDTVMLSRALIESRSNYHFAARNGIHHEDHAAKRMPLIAHNLLNGTRRKEIIFEIQIYFQHNTVPDFFFSLSQKM